MTTGQPVEKPAPRAAPTRSPGEGEFEAHGGALANLLRGVGGVAALARVLLSAGGLSLPMGRSGPVIPDWFPLRLNLEVLEGIGRALGSETLFRIGFSVPEHARFPPVITDLPRALGSLDIAFHMNHRRDGVVMYDAATGGMLEGIGHYTFEIETEARLSGRSTSVYPCAFDFGIYSGLAARFEPQASVVHVPEADCRLRGASACAYSISR